MPFGKITTADVAPRKTYKRKPRSWYEKKYSVGEMATQALKGVMYLKGLVNSEKYYADVTGASAPDYNGAVVLVNNIAQGDDVNGRSGNSILVKSIYLQAQGNIHASATNTFLRYILLCDTQCLGTAPTASDILATVGSGSATMAPLNVDHTPRYRILMDKRIALNQAFKTDFTFHKFIKLQTHSKYTGSSATDVYKNAFYLVMISNEQTNTPTAGYYLRIGYHEN